MELVGREPELEQVAEWLELLSSGPSGLVVAGEPGIGKTSDVELDQRPNRGGKLTET